MLVIEQKWIKEASELGRFLSVPGPLGNAHTQTNLLRAFAEVQGAQIPLQIYAQTDQLCHPGLDGLEQGLDQPPQDLTFTHNIAAKPEPQPVQKALPRSAAVKILRILRHLNDGKVSNLTIVAKPHSNFH